MPDSTYNVLKIIGTSRESMSRAIDERGDEGGNAVRRLDRLVVSDMRHHCQWQAASVPVMLRLDFALEKTGSQRLRGGTWSRRGMQPCSICPSSFLH